MGLALIARWNFPPSPPLQPEDPSHKPQPFPSHPPHPSSPHPPPGSFCNAPGGRRPRLAWGRGPWAQAGWREEPSKRHLGPDPQKCPPVEVSPKYVCPPRLGGPQGILRGGGEGVYFEPPPPRRNFTPTGLLYNQEWPRQTKPKKGQFMNFSQGHSRTKVQCELCLFS